METCRSCSEEILEYQAAGAGPVNVSDPQGDLRFCNWDCLKEHAEFICDDSVVT